MGDYLMEDPPGMDGIRRMGGFIYVSRHILGEEDMDDIPMRMLRQTWREQNETKDRGMNGIA